MAFLYNASVCSQRPRASWKGTAKGTAVRPERFAGADLRNCTSLRRNAWTAVLILALVAPLGAQSQNCTLDALTSNLPLRSVSVNESLGDFRFSCTGFGAGPVEINVFFDGPFTNRTVVRNDREITAAMAIVEGVTPETAVFQIPGEPRNPGANVFLLERRDDRIGERLFAEGLPGNRPLIISGARGDVAAALNHQAVRTGAAGTLTKNLHLSPEFNASMVAAGQAAFKGVSLFVLPDGSLVSIWGLLARQALLSMLSGGSFLRSAEEEQLAALAGFDASSEVGEGFADPIVGDQVAILGDSSGLSPAILFSSVAYSSTASTTGGRSPLRKGQSEPAERLLRRVVEFDAATLSGGSFAEGEGSERVDFDANGRVLLLYEVV